MKFLSDPPGNQELREMKPTISRDGQENISFPGIHQSHQILATDCSSVTQEFCMEGKFLLGVQKSIIATPRLLLMLILV